MTRLSSQAQRARRLLSQATMQRSHRRGELIRLIPDIQTLLPTPLLENDTEQATGKQGLSYSQESEENEKSEESAGCRRQPTL